MTVSAAQVKELRAATGAGMMECKNALLESNGDAGQAERLLKDRGLAIAKKREERATNQGRIFGEFSDDAATLLELRCETDFVSENARFLELGEECVKEAHSNGLTEPNEAIQSHIVDAIAVIKENLVVNSLQTIQAGADELLAGYVHDGGKAAAVVKLTLGDAGLRGDERVTRLAFDLALHITAFSPVFIRPEEISANYREAYEAEYRGELEGSGKPEKLWDKIVAGKWNKHLREVCLTNQAYLRDEDISVSEAIDAVARETGSSIQIAEFACVSIAPAACL